MENPVNIVGLSMGGGIVTFFANRYPEKVKKLTLIDATPETPSLNKIFPLQIPLIGELLMRMKVIGSVVKSNTTNYSHPAKSENWDEMYMEQVRIRGFRQATLSIFRNAPKTNVEDNYRLLGNNPIPKQIIWGVDDETYPIEKSLLITQALSGAEFHAIEQGAHLPHYEQPEKVNSLLIEFLEE